MNVDVLIGDWDVVIDHRMLDGTVTGRQTFTPILGGKFLQLDWEVDHPDFPTHRNILNDEQLFSFDDRGVVRVYANSLADNIWTWWRDDADFYQRFTGTLSEHGTRINAVGEMSHDQGATWEFDLEFTYTRR